MPDVGINIILIISTEDETEHRFLFKRGFGPQNLKKNRKEVLAYYVTLAKLLRTTYYNLIVNKEDLLPGHVNSCICTR